MNAQQATFCIAEDPSESLLLLNVDQSGTFK